MLEQEAASRLCAVIEEELGGFRALADLPATEIEAMATRLARAIGPMVFDAPNLQARDAA